MEADIATTIRYMRIANDAVNTADGPVAYAMALVALALAAREFLRQWPEEDK